jgi:hypothetical protein
MRVLEPSSLASFDDEAVDAWRDRLGRGLQGRDHVEDGEAGILGL